MTAITTKTVQATPLMVVSAFSWYNVDVHKLFCFWPWPILTIFEAAELRNFHFFHKIITNCPQMPPNFSLLYTSTVVLYSTVHSVFYLWPAPGIEKIYDVCGRCNMDAANTSSHCSNHHWLTKNKELWFEIFSPRRKFDFTIQ